MSFSTPTTSSSSTGQVKVSSGDTTADYLLNKLVQGTNITLTKNNPGANETLTISAAAGGNIYSDPVTGLINSSNKVYTVPNTIVTAFALYLANSVYQPGVDFTVTGATQITMTNALDASLSGQPFWLSHN